MTPYQMVAVGVRLLAVFIVVTIVWSIPDWMMNYAFRVDDELVNWAFAVGVIFLALAAVVLWNFPMTVSKGILGQVADPAEGRYEAKDWFTVGCALIGVYLLATTISAALNNFIFNIWAADDYQGAWPVGLWVGYYLPQALIGLWLIFGAQGWTKLLWTIRNAGRPQAPSE